MSLLIDGWFYGEWTLVALNFVKFNVVGGLGTFFGSHPWHWYFSQGLPTMLFTFTPIFLLGVIAAAYKRDLLRVLLWDTTIHSFIKHKEFR